MLPIQELEYSALRESLEALAAKFRVDAGWSVGRRGGDELGKVPRSGWADSSSAKI